MSQEAVLKFLTAARDSTVMRIRYNSRNLSQLLFHAKNDGFEFTAAQLADVIGRLEASVIQDKDKDPLDGNSRLWRTMWGEYHLNYILRHVVRRHTDEELSSLIEHEKLEAAV